MRNISSNILVCFVLFASITFSACSKADRNATGHEYMQDMGHSIAYEANTIDKFYYNRWEPNEYHKLSQPRMPIGGTIPRGMSGVSDFSNSKEHISNDMTNSYIPYPYIDTEGDRAKASKEIINNPFPISKASLNHGKLMYQIYCGICHGEKGDGDGYLVRDGGKYPAQPANLLSDTFMLATNGRFYHAMMHGKNMMGSYKDKLSYKERWEVIMFIRSLQASAKGLIYSEVQNTLNKTDFTLSQFGIKTVSVSNLAQKVETKEMEVKDLKAEIKH